MESSERKPASQSLGVALAGRLRRTEGNQRDKQRPGPKNLHVDQAQLTPNQSDCLMRSPLGGFPGGQNLVLLQFVKRSSVPSIRCGDECARSEQMHHTYPTVTLLAASY